MLRVIPNPFAHLDGDGHPATVVTNHQTHRPIGAELVMVDGKLRKKFALTEPETVGDQRYYVDSVREGALIAWDEETAKACRVPFVEPKAALDAAMAEAAKRYLEETGKPAPFAIAEQPVPNTAPTASAPPAEATPELSDEEPQTRAPAKASAKKNPAT